MVSHRSHTNHEFLILVIQVTNVSSAIKSCHFLEFSYLQHFSLVFNFLICPTYYKLSYEKFCKEQVEEM